MNALLQTIRSFSFPPRAEWRAFWLGMREFRSDLTTHFGDWELLEAYDCGRELARVLTFRRYDGGAA